MPELGETLWQDFQELHTTRAPGLNGPGRITFADLQARQIVTGLRLEPWEVRAIFRLDAAFFEVLGETSER